jgi:hypothetical protein
MAETMASNVSATMAWEDCMKYRFRLCLCLLLLAGSASLAWAQTSGVSPQGIPYASGGVGSDERQAMTALSGQYDLKLEFAMREGDYLGDVQVSVRGPVNLEAVAEGPWFLVNLPAGTYQVTAVNGSVATTQSVTVGAMGQKRLVFLW